MSQPSTTSSTTARAPLRDRSNPRKRVSPAQSTALRNLFNAKSHPSRDERVTLAREVGMDLKAVTIWFQNKRQTTKKSLRSGKENTIPVHQRMPVRKTQSFPDAAFRPLKETISLDHFAERCQRHSLSPAKASFNPPLTPRNTNIRSNPSAVVDKSELWTHMLSSPPAPPSPTTDISRFSVLPTRSKSMRSLEWACAKARVSLKRDDPPCVPGDRRTAHAKIIDTIERHIVTPNSSTASSPTIASVDCDSNSRLSREPSSIGAHPSEEVEAAMVLLGLMSQR